MLAVVDGADFGASSCGFLDMGTARISVPRKSFPDWEKKRNLVVYLESGGSGVSVKMEDSLPAPSDSLFRRLIGRLIYKGGAYALIQEQHGPVEENYHMILGDLNVVG